MDQGSSVVVMKNHENHESEELESVVTGRRRVIAMSILKGAKTPEQVMVVATSIGEGTLGNDPIILQILSDYWAAEAAEAE